MRRRQPPPTTPTTDVRILEIAADHIRRYGIARTTVTRIAEEANMSHANIYRYYPSKEALIEEITAAWLRPLEAGLRTIADAPDPAFDKLERIVFAIHRAYRDKLENDPNLFELFVTATQKNTPIARKHRNRSQLEIQRTLEEGASGGLFVIPDQKRALALVLDTLHRFIMPVAVKLDLEIPRAGLEDRAQRVTDLVLGALANGRY
ncbi:MAG TPA: TetR/AcrR family transcriptional regulator [Beijerinckia sp.]|jgi:AcrR family transcriptional regulator|nr:TetR/AcrR family transcriptional regulator [Beijerinckia sp.]